MAAEASRTDKYGMTPINPDGRHAAKEMKEKA
jgi:hypothetical protein